MTSIILRTIGCTILCSVLFVGRVVAQTCPNSQPYQTITYDTTATGSGNINFNVPLFDPSIGTLYTVQANLDTYLTYNYTLTNSTGAPADYDVQVKRKDVLTATSPGNPTYNFFPTSFATTDYDYIADDGFPQVPIGTTSYSQQVYNPRHLTNTYPVPFLGSGTLNLSYTGTTTYLAGGNTDVAISQTGAKDSIRLTIVYNYCPAVALASTYINLTSSIQSGNVLLAWTSQENITSGSYELLKSIDGRTYISVNKQPVNRNSLAGYNYLYKPTAQDPTKAFFRVKQTDQNGNVTYSKVITVILPTDHSSGSVDQGTDKKLVVYPTIPTNFINVFIPSGTNTDEWNISIVSLSGNIMQQSKFSNTNLARVNLKANLSSGIYIVDAYNSRTQEHYKDKIVVQH